MKSRRVDRKVVDWVLNDRDRMCLYGFMRSDPCTTAALHVHHIQKRSACGNDVKENLITLCAHHHDQAEKHYIKPEELRNILGQLYGYGL
jgi:predicted restriction endonuclease